MCSWSKNVRNRRHDSLSRVDWRELERLLADHYRRQGYRVEHCGTGVSNSRFDGGIDLKLFRDQTYLVVQCKHWNARQVTHNAMHELAGITLTEGATGAILVTSGEFTAHAKSAAAKLRNMQLVDGDMLREMLGEVSEPELAAPLLDDRAARMVAEIGGRVVYAGANRVRQQIRQTPKAAIAHFDWLPLVKVVLLLMLLWAFITFVSSIGSRLQTTLTTQVAPPTPAVAPTPLVEERPSQSPAPPLVTTVPAVTPQPTVYRHPSQMTEAEIRKQQRLADEAIRVLAPNTPEMDMGYPDDPRANRYKAPEEPSGATGGWGR